jgi:hypothetical protein
VAQWPRLGGSNAYLRAGLILRVHPLEGRMRIVERLLA